MPPATVPDVAADPPTSSWSPLCAFESVTVSDETEPIGLAIEALALAMRTPVAFSTNVPR